ncbi:MAG: response regulator [Candidatus Omnitrophota bacterium]|nr:response regulator [Candidatus Omnitrophota bacterium]MBU1929031.1 response regulator [Candidatus Omnitrophota bacterium]MBU2035276.1 response regulator [Candidatus Omnitrophota bacterium]MBU2222343.1 response regulator [Candidatus Omnitrophota bacterium]MBU2257673.1 response regulator [Candidatus Omnitrophota bacterium]
MAKKILIADDDPSLVEVLTSRLRQHNYEVICAFDAMQVMTMAMSRRPDLIILDIKMPAGTGRGALENLKNSSTTFTIPVIVITAYPNEEVRGFAVKNGVVDFIEKPFQVEVLLNSIERVFRKEEGGNI